MKKLLLFCIISIVVTACKKEEEESLPSLKLKMATTTNSSGPDQKVTFDYDQKGNLKSAKKYSGGVLHSYFEYIYEAGILTGAKSYVKSLAGNSYDSASDVKFTYVNNKLSEISIQPALNAFPSQPAKYSFEYGNDETPVKVKLQFFNKIINEYSYNDIMSYPFRIIDLHTDYGERWNVPNLPAPQVVYEFDHNNNPFYKLPWLDVEFVKNKVLYTFTPLSFFNKYNRTKMLVTIDGSPIYTYLSTYTYSATGYPEKSTNTQYPGNFQSESRYEYW